MSEKQKQAVLTGVIIAGAFCGFVLAIRIKYGIDAPFEDFMPIWMSKAAYWINRWIPSFTYFEDGSFIVRLNDWIKFTGCNPFGICN